MLAAVTDEYWPSVTFIIIQATGRRYLLGKVVSHMTMSLDGFIADPQDGVAELFGWYEAGTVIRKDCFDQNSASTGATVTRSFTASASCRSSVIKASASSWVRATYSASNVSDHPSWSATFHAAF